jgi:hypothetical protein
LAWPICPAWPDTLVMLMIRPPLARSIGRVTALSVKKAPNRFVSSTSRHASVVMRMIRSSRVMPALLTRMSTLPNSASAALTSSSAASGWVTSACRASPRRPSRVTSPTVSSAAAALPR